MPEDKIIPIEVGLLRTCSGEERDALVGEALLLADAFAPDGGSPELLAMAETLTSASPPEDAERRHARKLAATLRMIAKDRHSPERSAKNQKESDD